LLAGRAFSEKLDAEGTMPVTIINEAFQQKYFPNEDSVGMRIQPFTVSTNWHEIVGVVRDVKLTGLDVHAAPEIYQPDSQHAPWMFSLVVRSALPPRQIEKLVEAEVAALDKNLPFFNVGTMEQAISTSAAPQRFVMMLTGLFAALALTLTAVGIYGVVSYSVSQRTQEFGIRVALGASRWSVLGIVLRQGMAPALVGVGIGLAASFALSELIASQLFEVSPTDPATLVAICLLLMLVILMACYVPARLATRVDPMAALRCE
jgi:putative ABC transport system permease protein